MKKREEMLRDLHRRMDEYEYDRRMKRAKVTKVAASVTPVCAAAVVGVGLWKGGVLTPNHDQLISSTIESATSDVILSANNNTSADNHSANNKITTDKNGEPATSSVTADRQATTSDVAITPATENVTEDSNASNAPVEADTTDNTANTNDNSQKTTEAPAVQSEAPVQQTTSDDIVQNGNSYYLKGDEEPPEYLTLITSYPSGQNSMAVPPIGNYGCSHSLYLAMEDYKDTANYLVIADVFNANGQVFSYDELAAEAERLYNNGYTAAVESVNDQSGAYHFISLNVTYEQLEHFAVRSDYAYALRLYNN